MPSSTSCIRKNTDQGVTRDLLNVLRPISSHQMMTAIPLHFQVTNVSDGAVKLSSVRLRRPHVRKLKNSADDPRRPTPRAKHILQPIYSSGSLLNRRRNPHRHRLPGWHDREARVVVEIRHHAGRWYKAADVQDIGHNMQGAEKRA
jgi:hypothetical protein